MIKFFTSPDLETIGNNDIVIFLAGPIQGAVEWHKECFELIKKEYETLFNSYNHIRWNPVFPNLFVASPKREIIDDKFDYKEQVLWETHHLRLAGKQGVILFWFANEKEQIIENGKINSFGKTSRFEFGEWKTRHDTSSIKVVLGLDTDWKDEKYFKVRIEQDGSDIPICYNLENTVKETVKLCFNL